jgi:MtaA/CmuA family methyltransferase
MEKDKFICLGDNLEEIPECIITETGLTFPKAHTNKADMVLLAKEIKKYKNDSICRIPFCVTVETEALGANIKLGDMKAGPRVGSYAFNTIEELERIKRIDLNSGRIKEVLDSIETLNNEGETAVLSVEGPFTIISSLMDPMIFYRILRKNVEAVDKLLIHIEDSIVNYITEGVKRGAKIISYGDPVGAIDITGPKVFKDFSGKSTYRILKRIEPMLNNTLLHICGKTSTALESTGFCQTEALEFDEGITYGKAINEILLTRKDVRIIGNGCIKRTPIKMSKPVVWVIKL